jgi:hypothetical protein
MADCSRDTRTALNLDIHAGVGSNQRRQDRAKRDEDMEALAQKEGFHTPLAKRYRDRFTLVMNDIAKQDKELGGWEISMLVSNRLYAEPSVHARPFRKTRKYLYLFMPVNMMFKPKEQLLRGGRLIGGIVAETDTTMLAWAVKVGASLSKTAWALAHFERNESGDWCFRHWKRTKTKTNGDK